MEGRGEIGEGGGEKCRREIGGKRGGEIEESQPHAKADYSDLPVWKVSIAQPRYRPCNFDALYIFTSKFSNLRCVVFKLPSQGDLG